MFITVAQHTTKTKKSAGVEKKNYVICKRLNEKKTLSNNNQYH